MRKFILNVHLYGGLICAPYLLIFGFSSLHFNHHFSFVEPIPNSQTWEAPLHTQPMSENEKLADAVRDDLGLMGWPLFWKMKRDSSGDLEFEMERPGKSYTIRTDFKQAKAYVVERHKGFWQVVNSLHGSGQLPNSRFVPLWGIYTEICTAFVLFAGVSGLYLWVNSRRERSVGLWTVSAATAFSVVLMLVVVFRG
jgi:hypothetical protein